jgi:hypothetical protein
MEHCRVMELVSFLGVQVRTMKLTVRKDRKVGKATVLGALCCPKESDSLAYEEPLCDSGSG